ncbi:hypothetical protein GCM10027589_05290 [Actinocorallia lasiicapitis]
MSDLEEIRTLYGTPAPPAPHVVVAARARALPRRTSRRRWLLLAPVAGVAAVAVGMALLSGPAPEGEETLAVPTANVPTPKLSDQGRRWYVQATETQVKKVGQGKRRYYLETRRNEENWYGYRTPGSYVRAQYLGAKPVSEKDAAAWRAAGSPRSIPSVNCKPIPGRIVCQELAESPRVAVDAEKPTLGMGSRDDVDPAKDDRAFLDGPFSLEPMSLADLRALPVDPGELRSHLLAQAHDLPEDEPMSIWLKGMYLLLETPVEGRVRGAALEMLRRMPGARNLKNVTDAEGRKGDAVSWTTAIPDAFGLEGDREYRVIYERGTLRPLAAETRYLRPTANFADAAPGTLWQSFTVLASGWTDDKPRIP